MEIDTTPMCHLQPMVQPHCHLLSQYIGSLKIWPDGQHTAFNAPEHLHALPLFQFRQVQSTTTDTSTSSTVSNTSALSQ